MKVRLLDVARLLVASMVTASFVITVAPLGTASFAPAGMKDCCIGKPGHVPGSCATGLLASSKKSHLDSPTSFDNDPISMDTKRRLERLVEPWGLLGDLLSGTPKRWKLADLLTNFSINYDAPARIFSSRSVIQIESGAVLAALSSFLGESV